MFGGDMCDVKLRFENSLCGVVIDRFGKEVIMVPDSDNHFVINVKVSVSPMFLVGFFPLVIKSKFFRLKVLRIK